MDANKMPRTANPPSYQQLAAAYGDVVTRQRLFQLGSLLGFETILDPTALFEKLLDTGASKLRHALVSHAARARIAERIQLTRNHEAPQ